jgi:hypothetical protein
MVPPAYRPKPTLPGRFTLVYCARDSEHKDAVVLAEVLRRGLPTESGEGRS